jgi:hypothetical protein
MIPANISFHDATIVSVSREGDDCVLEVEDVVIGDGDEIVAGTITFEGVSRITVDGEEAEGIEMAGDDGEILEFEELPGPVARLSVIWTQHQSHDEEQNLYLVECSRIRWQAGE